MRKLILIISLFFAISCIGQIPSIGAFQIPGIIQQSGELPLIAVGYDGYSYSYDGISWTYIKGIKADLMTFDYNLSVLKIEDRVIISGNSNSQLSYAYTYTPEDSTWINCGPISNVGCYYFTSNNDTLLSFGGFSFIRYSIDYGFTWSNYSKSGTGLGRIYDMIKKDNLYIIGGSDNWYETIAYSTDLINWTNCTNEPFPYVVFTLAQNDNIIVAGGGRYNAQTTTIAYSYDGISWTASNNLINIAVRKIVWYKNKFIASGTGATNNLAYSYDGINWTGLGLVFPVSPYNSIHNFFIYNDTLFLGIQNAGTWFTEDDGFTWTKLENNLTTKMPNGVYDIK